MKEIRVEDAVGHVLCHDMTLIVKGAGKTPFKGPRFRKGHIIIAEDIPVLLSMGKEHIYVWEAKPGFLHEDEAAFRLDALFRGANITAKGPVEGKIEHFAACDGLFCANLDAINAVNSIDGLAIVTRHRYSAVKTGDKLAAMKAIPLTIDENLLKQAENLCHDLVISHQEGEKTPLLQVLPWKLKTARIIVTGSEIEKGRIADTFAPVVAEKLAAFGIEAGNPEFPGDDPEKIAQAIAEARLAKPDMIICTGGMSVDSDDNTPGAIKRSGAKIISYGAPVFPGAMYLQAYFDDGVPLVGLPGCVMFAGATIFDALLPRMAAGIPIAKADITQMGHGGLCLGCVPCRYPVCPFAK